MARRTVADKRGSVRGAPPDVYLPFGSFGSEEEELAAFQETASLFANIGKMLLLYLLVMFCVVVYYIFSEPPFDYD